MIIVNANLYLLLFFFYFNFLTEIDCGIFHILIMEEVNNKRTLFRNLPQRALVNLALSDIDYSVKTEKGESYLHSQILT